MFFRLNIIKIKSIAALDIETVEYNTFQIPIIITLA